MIQIEPRDYNSKITTIKALQSYISTLKDIDVSKFVDSSIEDASDFINASNNAVSIPTSKAEGEADGLWEELRNDVRDDFTEKFNNYIFLVEHKLDDGDIFPFNSWQRLFDQVKDDVFFDHEEVLSNIEKLANLDKDIAIYNIANYLDVIQYQNIGINGLFPHLNKIINKYFPQSNLLDVLSCTKYADFIKALNGETFTTKENSHLIFEYANFSILENWAIKTNFNRHLINIYNIRSFESKEQYPDSLGLGIPLYLQDMDQVYQAFSESEIWGRIKDSNNLKKEFIKILSLNKNESISSFHIKNVEHFVNHLSKEDVNLAEEYFTQIGNKVYGSKRDEAQVHFDNALKIALKFSLDKEMPQSDIQVKRLKV